VKKLDGIDTTLTMAANCRIYFMHMSKQRYIFDIGNSNIQVYILEGKVVRLLV